jgi:hypothetical protein
MQLRSRLFIVPFLLIAVMILQPLQANAADANRSCFNETGFCMEGRIKQYWEQNGGLAVFGFPISDQHQELVEGKPFQVQVFQRNRLELHPENAAPYDVLLGRLGAVRLEQQGRDWTKFGKSAGGPVSADCLAFSDTGQNVCGPFLSYFKTHGLEFDGAAGKSYAESLALFGLPISPSVVETNGSGDTVETQWFERARFEYHPNNPDPYKVELGLLGSEVKDGAANTPPPVTTPPPPAAPTVACKNVPAAVTADIYPSSCVAVGTFLWMHPYGFNPNERIGFWLNDPDGYPVVGTRTTYTVSSKGDYVIRLNTAGSGFYPGIWSIVAQGETSHHQSIYYIRLMSDSDTGITLSSVNGAKPGGKASVAIKTAPNLACNLDYYGPDGYRSSTEGLGKQTTDANGNATWTWTIGNNSLTGYGYVAVTCNDVTISADLIIN